MNLEQRVKALEKVLIQPSFFFVHVPADDTLENALKKFNIEQKTNLLYHEVIQWGSIPFKGGKVYLSPNIKFEKYILERIKIRNESTSETPKN